MLSGRTRFVAVAIAIVALGSVISAMGPFGAHPSITYPQFLADVQAGRVDEVVQWRDRLEVTIGPDLVLVTVPADVDLTADLGRAQLEGGVVHSFGHVPDDWLVHYTPWVPLLLFAAGLFLWLRAVRRERPDRSTLVVDATLS